MKTVLITVLLLSAGTLARAQTWEFIAPMQYARAESQAAMLHDGRILVAGGYSGSVLSSCEIYDPRTNTWQSTGNMLTPRYRFELKTLPSGKVAAFGGLIDRGVGTTGKCEVWDPATDAWSALPTLPEPRENFPTAYLDDSSVILVGGLDANNTRFLNQCYILDAKKLTFSQIPSMFIGTYSHFGHYVPSIKTFVTGSGDIGGVDGDYLRSTENYDLTTKTWTLGDSLSNPVADGNQHTVQMRDGTIVLPGGRSEMNATTQDVQVFDPRTKHWYVRGQLLKPHFHCNCFLIGEDSILTIGGVTDPAYAANIVKYCTWYRFSDSSSWAGPDLLEPVQVYSTVRYMFPGSDGCFLKQAIYIFGGEAGSKVPMNRCEKLEFIVGSSGINSSSTQHLELRSGVRGDVISMPMAEDLRDTAGLRAKWGTLKSVSGTFSYDSSRLWFNSITPNAGWSLTGINDNGKNVQFTVKNQAASYSYPLNVASAVFQIHDTANGMTRIVLNDLTLHYTSGDETLCLGQTEDALWGIVVKPQSSDVGKSGAEDGALHAVPNPFAERITLTGDVESVVMYDLLGHTIATESSRDADGLEIVTSSLPSGMYLLVCKTGEGMKTVRVVK